MSTKLPRGECRWGTGSRAAILALVSVTVFCSIGPQAVTASLIDPLGATANPLASQTVFSLQLSAGYNFISLPLANYSFTASKLLDVIGNAGKSVTRFDSGRQSYITYDRELASFGVPQDDFNIEPDAGYIVYASQGCVLTIRGTLPTSRVISLRAGYNLVGWTSPASTSATTAFVSTSNGAVRSVTAFDGLSQEYVTYDVALANFGVAQPDFQISQGGGYFLFSSTPSTLQYDSASTTESPALGRGLNYLSLYHLYSSAYTADSILHRDFSKFQQDGLEVISLSLYWYRLEGNKRGDYDGEYLPYPQEIGGPYGRRFLDNVKRVIRIAWEHGIKVLVTIHTLWGAEDSPWCTPDYVVDPVTRKNSGLAIVRSENMKQAFIDMFAHTVSYLAGTDGIWAWAILNEPWYSPKELPSPYESIDQKENFIDLIQKLSKIVKTLDGRPVTVRFCNTHTWIAHDGLPRIKNIFIDDWNWDERIFDALDFVSFNIYVSSVIRYPALFDTWQDMTSDNIIGSTQRGKKVWATELGFNSDDDAIQAKNLDRILQLLAPLPVDGCIAWFWEGDHTDRSGNAWGEPGRGMNLCADSNTGEGRPAYHELVAG